MMDYYPAYNGGQTYSGRTNDYNVEANTIIVSQGWGFLQVLSNFCRD